jgi:hypothetical protein
VGGTNANILETTRLADLATSMSPTINALETGGSENQFSMLAQNISESVFQIYLGFSRLPAGARKRLEWGFRLYARRCAENVHPILFPQRVDSRGQRIHEQKALVPRSAQE